MTIRQGEAQVSKGNSGFDEHYIIRVYDSTISPLIY